MKLSEPECAASVSERGPLRQDLTASQTWLLEIMRAYQFGRVEDLQILAGAPVPHGGEKIVHIARLGCESKGTEACGSGNFELKQSVRDLFSALERLQNGMIVKLEFKHGLPWLLETTAALDKPIGRVGEH